MPLLESALARLSEDELELRSRLLARLAGALRDDPVPERRKALSAKALELARRSGDALTIAVAVDSRVVSMTPDSPDILLALADELYEFGQQSGDRERVVHAHTDRAYAYFEFGDARQAREALAAATSLAQQLRQPTQLWLTAANNAAVAIADGRFREATELDEQARRLGERAQPHDAIAVDVLHRFLLADFLDTLGDVEPATRDAAAAYPARPVFRCMLARIYQRSGELHQAHAIFDELARDAFAGLIVDPDWLCAVSLLIETGVALEEERSVRVLRDLIRPFEDRVVSNIPEGIRGAAPRYSALAASAYGDWSDADSSFRAAIERNERAGFRPWLALTQYEYAAELLRREGERDHVRKLLDAAHATFVDLRMETHAARAAELQSLVEMVGPSPSGS